VDEKEDLGKGITLDMVLIPAGKFTMGSPVSQPGRGSDETQHEVTLTKHFYMGKYEVTQEQWESVMGNNPSTTKGAKLPVTDVSWEDCQEFIKKLNAKTNGGYRLPTEAEWEYACRAGTTTMYSFGTSLTSSDANIEGNSIKAVGSYKANIFKLYDMHGNVWEWCEDWYEDYPAGSVTDPKGPSIGKCHVIRGGSYYFSESIARSAYWNLFTPTYRQFNVGFRLARTVNVKAAIAPTGLKPYAAEVMPTAGNLLVSPFTEAKAKEVQKDVAKSLQKEVEEKEDLGKGVSLDMVLIPAGKFIMGSPASEPSRQPNERQHEVTLTKPFYIGKYEVTQDQWQAVMGDNPSSVKGPRLPVTDIFWENSQDFIKKLNTKTNGGYRLPTEAEWEYACRAGTTTAYLVGDSLTKTDANIEGGSTKSVGSYKPNSFGLYDMHGNVYEWCEDWYRFYLPGTETDPKGPATGSGRVLRGGSFFYAGSGARSSLRFLCLPNHRLDHLGFRLARTVDVKTAVALTLPKPDPVAGIPTIGNLLLAPFTEAKAKEVQIEVAKSLQKEVEEKEDLGKGIKLEMVLIPAGKFLMGSPTTEVGRNKDETQHEVTLTKPYYLGKHEVTQDQWQAVMGNNPSSIKGPRLPVTNVSWNDCQDFINNLNTKTNRGYRLPTDAEWEYACRAGTTTAYSVEDKIIPLYANYNKSGKGKPTPAASFKPNAFGLYDMHGNNVWEWCEDWKADYPERAVTDPKGSQTGKFRVLRGGSYDGDLSTTRSSLRNDDTRFTPSDRLFNRGFRLAKTP
jgi:formylglycine-generating enzyme required for sulfatase activity